MINKILKYIVNIIKKTTPKTQDVKVSLLKYIDTKNKLILVEYKNKQYLIITNSNGATILDKYETDQ